MLSHIRGVGGNSILKQPFQKQTKFYLKQNYHFPAAQSAGTNYLQQLEMTRILQCVVKENKSLNWTASLWQPWKGTNMCLRHRSVVGLSRQTESSITVLAENIYKGQDCCRICLQRSESQKNKTTSSYWKKSLDEVLNERFYFSFQKLFLRPTASAQLCLFKVASYSF